MLNIVSQVTLVLGMLGVMAMVVSGFLVTNVMNAMVVEQRQQIGTLKSIGATTWDNFVIYAGIALCYGAVGVALAVPVAALMSRAIATQALTYVAGWPVSAQGIALGVVMGLLVPVVAALLPVLNGMRISRVELGPVAHIACHRRAAAAWR